ncbi:Calx-beta domain-containing protein [Abyssibacter profundi]|nr:Calx-beta domain-containing protein [Abyssibacter profundi]
MGAVVEAAWEERDMRQDQVQPQPGHRSSGKHWLQRLALTALMVPCLVIGGDELARQYIVFQYQANDAAIGGEQTAPAVATAGGLQSIGSNADGSTRVDPLVTVTVWESPNQDGDTDGDRNIYGLLRITDAVTANPIEYSDGDTTFPGWTHQEIRFAVNSDGAGDQSEPRVAITASDGSFPQTYQVLVTWTDSGSGVPVVKGRLFAFQSDDASTLAPLDGQGEFTVFPGTFTTTRASDVAFDTTADPIRRFLVSAIFTADAGTDRGLIVRQIAADDAAGTGNVITLVATESAGAPVHPLTQRLAAGRNVFGLVWDFDDGAGRRDVRWQLFGADGSEYLAAQRVSQVDGGESYARPDIALGDICPDDALDDCADSLDSSESSTSLSPDHVLLVMEPNHYQLIPNENGMTGPASYTLPDNLQTIDSSVASVSGPQVVTVGRAEREGAQSNTAGNFGNSAVDNYPPKGEDFTLTWVRSSALPGVESEVMGRRISQSDDVTLTAIGPLPAEHNAAQNVAVAGFPFSLVVREYCSDFGQVDGPDDGTYYFTYCRSQFMDYALAWQASGPNDDGDIFVSLVGDPGGVDLDLSVYDGPAEAEENEAGLAFTATVKNANNLPAGPGFTVRFQTPFSGFTRTDFNRWACNAESGSETNRVCTYIGNQLNPGFEIQLNYVATAPGSGGELSSIATVHADEGGQVYDGTGSSMPSEGGFGGVGDNPGEEKNPDTTRQSKTVETSVNSTPPVVSLPETTSEVLEDAGTLTVTVALDKNAEDEVSIPYSLSGTATAGDDYSNFTASPIVIAAGSREATIQGTVVDDSLDEGRETVVITLGTPTNATLGANDTHTLTIQDDDPLPTLSVADVTVTEGDADTVNAVFTVSLSAASGRAVTVAYATSDGSARTADGDYQARSGTLSFAAGETTKTVTVPVQGDTRDEADETFELGLSDPSNATVTTNSATGTITDDDPLPALSIADASQAEGDSGTRDLQFSVQLSAASGRDITVAYATSDGTATTADSDYNAASGTLTFAAGETQKTIEVSIVGDTRNEADETFEVTLSNPAQATLDQATATGTIQNDEGLPTLSVADVSVAEGHSGTTAMTFTVELSAVSGQTVTADYATVEGTATDGDFVAATGQITIPAGQSTASIEISVQGDRLDEADETFDLVLSNPGNAALEDGRATGTIVDDDATPSLAIAAATVTEGNSGQQTLTLAVTLSAASGRTVTVRYTTRDGSATTADGDYQARSGQLSFAPSETSQSIQVAVNGDTRHEPDEQFSVRLSEATNATIQTATANGTITNDDAVPELRVGNAQVEEGNSGTATLNFTVSLSAASGQAVSMQFATRDDSATTGDSDYSAASGSLTIPAGETSRRVAVTVAGDTRNEADETLQLVISEAQNAQIVDATGVGTIVNDDPLPALRIEDRSIAEGDSGTSRLVFPVSLSAASGRMVTVSYQTADGTATTADGDYVAASGSVAFAPGETAKTIEVQISGDTVREEDESFSVTLSSPANASLERAAAAGTIVNDEGVPTVTVADVEIAEGDSGLSPVVFEVRLSAESASAVTLDFATRDGSATTVDNDYESSSGTLTFAPGETAKSVTVNVRGDALDEADEQFQLQLSNASGAAIGDSSATATITDDDPLPALSIADVTYGEGNSGSRVVEMTISLSRTSGRDVSLSWASRDGTATTADGDYQAGSGSLTIPAGSASATIGLQLGGDTRHEADEHLTVTLSNPTHATLADDTGRLTIRNDDAAPALSVSDVSVTEGNSGDRNAAFVVRLSAASGRTASVRFATADGSATASSGDYVARSGTLTFQAGETEKTVGVTVRGDTRDEPNETFTLALSQPSGASLGTSTATGTIRDDDAAPSLSATGASVSEGHSGTSSLVFQLDLSAASGKTVAVSVATADGSASQAAGDYESVATRVSFAPGETRKQVAVPVRGDRLNESDETLALTLGSASNATLATTSVTGTIVNDDPLPALSIGDTTLAEGDSGNTQAQFTVQLSAASGREVQVSYQTSDDSASASAGDYVSSSGTLALAPGETSATVTVPVSGDLLDEADERFVVTLSAPVRATLADAEAVGLIEDDDRMPELSIASAGVLEGDSGTVSLQFDVSLSAPSGRAVSVRYATADGTATTADGDYDATSGQLNFAAGQTIRSISVTVRGDTNVEADEQFTVVLTDPVNAVLETASATGGIGNDDEAGGGGGSGSLGLLWLWGCLLAGWMRRRALAELGRSRQPG